MLILMWINVGVGCCGFMVVVVSVCETACKNVVEVWCLYVWWMSE